MRRILTIAGLLMIMCSGMLLFAEFSSTAQTEITTEVSTEILFEAEVTSDAFRPCFIICLEDCSSCSECCPDGNGGFSCSEVYPPNWCDPK